VPHSESQPTPQTQLLSEWALRRSPGLRAIYNLLGSGGIENQVALTLAQSLDLKLRSNAPDGWRGVLAKENEVKRLIFELVHDTALVERLFAVVKAQAEY
jgi:type I restriction enzyme R subunit